MIRTACASSSKVAFFIVICQEAVHNGTVLNRKGLCRTQKQAMLTVISELHFPDSVES